MTRRAAKRRPIEAGRDGNPIEIELRQVDKDSGAHVYNTAVHPLNLLHSKRIVEPFQFAAGERFMSDYQSSQVGPCGAVEVKERVQGGGGVTMGMPAYRLDALHRVKSALDSVNAVSRLFILDVCVDDRNLEQIALKRGFSRHYAGPRLREALTELAEHYGLA